MSAKTHHEIRVVVAMDNVTLRVDSADPEMPKILFGVASLSNKMLERNRAANTAILEDLVLFGSAFSSMSADGTVSHYPLSSMKLV